MWRVGLDPTGLPSAWIRSPLMGGQRSTVSHAMPGCPGCPTRKEQVWNVGTLEHGWYSMQIPRWWYDRWNWDFMQICRFKAPNAIAQVMSVRRYEQAFERQEDKWPVGLPGCHQWNVRDQLVQAFPGRIGMSQTIFSSTHLRMTWHQVRRRGFLNW